MSALREEIERLRGRRGIWRHDLTSALGPELTRLAGLNGTEDAQTVRSRVARALEELSHGLPEDLALVFLGFLAAHEEIRQPTLNARAEYLADRLPQPVVARTTWRWFDQALDRITEQQGDGGVSDHGFAPPGWYLASLHTTLDLAGASPEAVERRSVVATRDGLEGMVVSTYVPRHGAGGRSSHELFVEPLGGTAGLEAERLGEGYFRHLVRFPRPLARGENHEVVIRVRIPPGQPMRPEYVFRPLRRCDRFSLKVLFGDTPPEWTRRVDGLPHGADIGSGSRPGAESLCLEFGPLRPGLGYGAVWG